MRREGEQFFGVPSRITEKHKHWGGRGCWRRKKSKSHTSAELLTPPKNTKKKKKEKQPPDIRDHLAVTLWRCHGKGKRRGKKEPWKGSLKRAFGFRKS